MPQAASLYEQGPGFGGGAERQTHLLARALAEQGLNVAHIVFPRRHPAPSGHPRLAVVERRERSMLDEPRRIWQVLAQADAQTYLVRTATPALGIAGLFCRRHGRQLIFSSANDGDFTRETIAGRSVLLYKLGLRLTDAVVVQSAQQVELARRVLPTATPLVEIPSFVEPTEQADPHDAQAFLWIGRLAEYKRPMRYLELAAAMPEAKFRMIQVMHDVPAGMPEALRRRAAELPNVELLDARSHGETMDLVSEAVAVVNTSRLEGMPNVFLEAWAHGIPVLSLECDPDARIAKNGLGIAAEGSWQRFVDGARHFWRERGERATYQRAANEYLAANHAPAVVASRWMQVIRSLA